MSQGPQNELGTSKMSQGPRNESGTCPLTHRAQTLSLKGFAKKRVALQFRLQKKLF